MERFNYRRVAPQLLQAVLDNPFEGTVIVDDQSVIQYFSKANEPYYNITSEGAMGRQVCEVIPSSGLPEVVRSGRPLLGDTLDVGGRKVIINYYPLKVGEKIVGAVGKMIFHNLKAFTTLQHKIGELESTVRRYQKEIREIYRARYSFADVIGRSAKLSHARDAAERLAASTSPILLIGESGTGKEIFAHAIHQASARRDRSFIRVNCASIPTELFESELFGYQAGAFSGALKSGKPGKFELAHQGTIFLDEIGELPLGLQAKLLRVLQEKEIEPLGAQSPKMIDFRVIAATNRDLEERVREGYFRRDLFYRLNVITLQLPPLREIREDVPVLTEHFLMKLRRRLSSPVVEIAPQVMEIFRAYHWPGNVRELENVVERALAICQEATIRPEHLPDSMVRSQAESAEVQKGRLNQDHSVRTETMPAPQPTEWSGPDDALPLSVDNAAREQLLEALRRAGGNRTEAAALLKIHRTTFYFRLRKYGLSAREIGRRGKSPTAPQHPASAGNNLPETNGGHPSADFRNNKETVSRD